MPVSHGSDGVQKSMSNKRPPSTCSPSGGANNRWRKENLWSLEVQHILGSPRGAGILLRGRLRRRGSEAVYLWFTGTGSTCSSTFVLKIICKWTMLQDTQYYRKIMAILYRSKWCAFGTTTAGWSSKKGLGLCPYLSPDTTEIPSIITNAHLWGCPSFWSSPLSNF